MKVAGAIEPCLCVEIGNVDDEGVPFPAPTGITHRPLDGALGMLTVQVDVTKAIVLEQHADVGRRLNDLKRKRHVHDARDTRLKALRLRVQGETVLEVLVPCCQRRRQIRELAAFDNTLAGRDALGGLMVLNIPGGGGEGLPDARKIRLAIGSAGQPVRCSRSRRLSGHPVHREPSNPQQNDYGGDDDRGAYGPTCHLVLVTSRTPPENACARRPCTPEKTARPPNALAPTIRTWASDSAAIQTRPSTVA